MLKALRAFSLIELMVVIAIVAILAAIAVPMYASYSKRAKVTEAINLADDVVKKAVQYHSSKGVLAADMTQLGYPASVMPNSVSEYPYPPYIAILNYMPSQASSACDNFTIAAYVSNYDSTGAFTATNNMPFIYFGLNYYNINGIWQHSCIAVEQKADSSIGTENYVPNCYNEANPSDVTAWQAQDAALAASC